MTPFKINRPRGTLAIWRNVVGFIFSEPIVLLPFLLLAAVETIVLYLLASSPHYPVNLLLAPPIRNIWGEVYLHYPFIYDLLPRLFYYAKLVTGVFIGSVTSGMAVLVIYCLKKNKQVDFKAIFFSVLKRYVSLFFLMAILFAGVHFLMPQSEILLLKYFRHGHPKFLFLGPKFWFNIFQPIFSFLMLVILQALFVYVIPYIVLKEKKFLSAFFSSIRLFFRLALKTLYVVMGPMLFYIPMSILRSSIGFLEVKFFPEIAVLVLFLGILVGTVLIDILVTVATTFLFIEATDEK